MHVDLKEILGAIGPSASIVFAAWIFMSFLQNRYSAAFQLYRELIQQCREGEMSYNREGNVREQVLLFKRRFELMRLATNFGLVAAILLITTLIGGVIDVVIPSLSFVPPVATACAVLGFLLVIAAAALVIRENSTIHRAVDAELLDVPDLAQSTGQSPGRIDRARLG